jgi:cobalt-precorrin 5A hydrolase
LVHAFLTISLKADEEGLLALAAKFHWRLATYTPDEINAIRDRVPNPSDTVLKFTGAVGSAEPAALLSSGAPRLLVEKVKMSQMTVAVARVPF